MRPKLQKRSALKFAGRIIPEAERSGIEIATERSGIGLSLKAPLNSSFPDFHSSQTEFLYRQTIKG